MESRFLVTIILKASILAIIGFSIGCASTPPEADIFMGEGFRSSLPQKGTRVVVWGNHSGAVSRTLGWLHDHQILAVDPSWIEKELQDPGFAHRTRAEQKTQVLAAAKSVGAPLVLFAQVNDSQLGRKFDLMSFDNQKLKIFGVEIRGMKTETGDVVFGAKAWNSEPLVESEQIVHDLTTFALQKAWNEPDQVYSPLDKVVEPKVPQEEMAVVTSSPQEMIAEPEQSQSNIHEFTREPPLPDEVVEPRSQQEKVSVVVSSAEEPTLANDPEFEIVESEPLEEEPSLGLQVAGGAFSVLYAPFKIVYAGLGGLMGGVAYLVTAGNEKTAQSIWDASLGGTYWLKAEHLQGEEAIFFKGEPSFIDPIHAARIGRNGIPAVK
jgi:hypothetical protein